MHSRNYRFKRCIRVIKKVILYQALAITAVLLTSVYWKTFMKIGSNHPRRENDISKVYYEYKSVDEQENIDIITSSIDLNMTVSSRTARPMNLTTVVKRKPKNLQTKRHSMKRPKGKKMPPPGKRYSFEEEKILSISILKVKHISANIAIGCAITSRGLSSKTTKPAIWEKSLRQLPLFHQLLPSFCKTASSPYRYKFYLAYDSNDPWFSDEKARSMFSEIFFEKVDSLCNRVGGIMTIDLLLTSCNHSGSPAWAQNDAMMAAYMDDVRIDYFYRVNDDTVMITPGWADSFIQVLNQFDPPNVGVVGPSFSTNGYSNSIILTYDFVHRFHIDIFDFYYPRELNDWFADDWITHVHQPRAVRVKDIKVMHTQALNSRYAHDWTKYNLLDGLIATGRKKINEWMARQKWI